MAVTEMKRHPAQDASTDIRLNFLPRLEPALVGEYDDLFPGRPGLAHQFVRLHLLIWKKVLSDDSADAALVRQALVNFITQLGSDPGRVDTINTLVHDLLNTMINRCFHGQGQDLFPYSAALAFASMHILGEVPEAEQGAAEAVEYA